MIDWKKKLTSRKFWLSIAGLVSGLMLAFGSTSDATETVSGVILALGSVCSYIFAEGWTDSQTVMVQADDNAASK